MGYLNGKPFISQGRLLKNVHKFSSIISEEFRSIIGGSEAEWSPLRHQETANKRGVLLFRQYEASRPFCSERI